ncbi:hypothetical protein CMI40_01775 [Candidatus Pacearchaeota archaeon]|nr:hypothetical protein [Candidatus Pacearchaeota archaeon]
MGLQNWWKKELARGSIPPAEKRDKEYDHLCFGAIDAINHFEGGTELKHKKNLSTPSKELEELFRGRS